MIDNSEQHGQGELGGPQEDPQDSPVVSYTPGQRRVIHKGLRIWARVAIRSYMKRRESEHDVAQDDDGREGQEGTD